MLTKAIKQWKQATRPYASLYAQAFKKGIDIVPYCKTHQHQFPLGFKFELLYGRLVQHEYEEHKVIPLYCALQIPIVLNNGRFWLADFIDTFYNEKHFLQLKRFVEALVAEEKIVRKWNGAHFLWIKYILCKYQSSW
jgi:hypothetical protein